METRALIDWEHTITAKIENNRDKENFPKPESFGITENEVKDYIYDKQRILDREEERSKKLIVPGMLLVLPIIVLSGFGQGIKLLLYGVAMGVVLMMLYFAVMKLINKTKLNRMANPDIEKYLDAVTRFGE